MAKSPTMTLKFKGKWSPLMAALKPSSFGPKLKAEVKRATFMNVRMGARCMREEIQKSIDPQNAALTLAIKAPISKTLRTPAKMGGAALFQSVTGVVVEWHQGFAGILRTARGKKGEGLFNLGQFLHEGGVIPVTPKMRAMFEALAAASVTGDPSKLKGRARELWDYNPRVKWKPLRPSTTHIKIPARKFVEKAAERDDLKVFCTKQWQDAVTRALKV